MKTLPAWLQPGRDLSHSKDPSRLARSIDYFTRMLHATPPWITAEQRRKFYAIYKKADKMRERGKDVHVDHIVPLRHPEVCGLQVHWNLQILPAKDNMSKSNKWWPDSPHEICEMFEKQPEPFQQRLF